MKSLIQWFKRAPEPKVEEIELLTRAVPYFSPEHREKFREFSRFWPKPTTLLELCLQHLAAEKINTGKIPENLPPTLIRLIEEKIQQYEARKALLIQVAAQAEIRIANRERIQAGLQEIIEETMQATFQLFQERIQETIRTAFQSEENRILLNVIPIIPPIEVPNSEPVESIIREDFTRIPLNFLGREDLNNYSPPREGVNQTRLDRTIISFLQGQGETSGRFRPENFDEYGVDFVFIPSPDGFIRVPRNFASNPNYAFNQSSNEAPVPISQIAENVPS